MKKVYNRSEQKAFFSQVIFPISGVLLFFLFSGLNYPLLAQSTGVLPSFALKDVDGDNLSDAVIETKTLRIIVSSRTGNISLYYLKGMNFEENLFPPVLADLGYDFASDTISPFSIILNQTTPEVPGTQGILNYTLSRDQSVSDSLVVVSTANTPPNKLSLIRRFSFKESSYIFETETILTNFSEKEAVFGNAQLGMPGLKVRYGPGLFLDPFNPSTFIGLKPTGQDAFDTAEKLMNGVSGGGFIGIGMKTTYFCALMEYKSPVTLSAKAFEVKSNDPKKRAFQAEVMEMALPPFSMKPQESKSFSFNFYFGPKLLDELSTIHREQVTDYGFLSTVLLRVLQFFHLIVPNYGLGIIFLTLIVRAVLYPLTLSQTKSMAKMQKIQPLVQDIKDRFRDDPQKFNEEVLKLYQKHEVNPLGGCLPLILQLPVLIALYNTINICVELRKTPFLWMSDLSKADPFMILPIAITALMYYQQGKISDPQQQQMMTFMPMFMFVITWSLPSGLLIYWFVSSVLGVFQQMQANQITVANKEE